MTLRSKVYLLLIVFLSINIYSQAIVLQQGNSGYSGCKDSFIRHSNNGDGTSVNYGDSNTICTDICYS